MQKLTLHPLSTIFAIVYVLSLILSLVSAQSNPKQCISTFDPNTDYFPYKIKIEHAEDFSVEYNKNYKIVRNERSNEVNVLVMCGTPAPVGIPQGANIFYIPFDTVSVTDTTTLTFFELQGLRSTVRFMDTTFVTSPCVQKLAELGQIVPYCKICCSFPFLPNSDIANNATIRAQQLNQTEAIFGGFNDNSNNGKFITQSASADPGPLQRAEWIEYISLFFNTEDVAERRFNEMRDRYECHRNNSNQLAPDSRLKVSWVSYNSPASWNNFQQSWRVSNAEYLREYFADAGASLISPETNVFTSVEAVHDILVDSSIIVDETFGANTVDIFKTNFGIDGNNEGRFEFLKKQQLWRIDKLQNSVGGLDWFESALPEADVVLEDLISIILPDYQPAYERTWFRNIAQGEEIRIVTSNECSNPNSSLDPRGNACSILTSSAHRIRWVNLVTAAIFLAILII